ncbi:hypothetical protein Efla_004016 [Eimeria flavescens]
MSPWGGVLAFVAARRLSRSAVASTVSPRTPASETFREGGEEEAEVPKHVQEANARRALRSERRQLQAEMRDTAQRQLAYLRAAKNKGCCNPFRMQQAAGLETGTQDERPPLPLAGSTGPDDNLAHLEAPEKPQQHSAPAKKVGFVPRLQALFSIIRLGSDSDFSDSSYDDEAVMVRVASTHAVQRRSCLKSRGSVTERSCNSRGVDSRVGWSPVVEAAKYCKADPTVVCIVPDEDGVLKRPGASCNA